MSVQVVLGAQWGDEGKGKIVDLLSNETNYVVRYQGGANAGHTLSFDDTTIVLHLIPSGIFHPGAKCVIGNGVVIDPLSLVEEIVGVESHGTDLSDRLFISETAHMILPYHKALDKAKEKHKGDDAIGTTGRGIGPAYIHKIARTGIRMMDLLDLDRLEEKIKANLEEVNFLLADQYGAQPLDHQPMVDEIREAAPRLTPYIANTTHILHEAVETGQSILLEGAQGSLLDIDHGTYPFVTSSSPTAGGACTGSGIPPMAIESVIGITKAYLTRVGNGPFPTELEGEMGEQLRTKGSEFGATTGRPRRCGWLDLVALKYAVRVSGISEIALTKIDVLDGLEEIKVCTHYLLDGEETDIFPISLEKLEQVTPVYKTMPGWQDDINACGSRDELPEAAKEYLQFIENYLEVEVSILSTGPKRSQTLLF